MTLLSQYLADGGPQRKAPAMVETFTEGQRVTVEGHTRTYAGTYAGLSRFIAYDNSALALVVLDGESTPSMVHRSQVSADNSHAVGCTCADCAFWCDGNL